jgi:O-antigen/teichoic acid export membrane protein
VPATLIIFFFGDKILLLFGKSYSKSSMQILQILALSSIPFAISRVYVTIKRVQLKMVPVLVVYASSAIFSLALSLILLPRMGLRGLGIGWLVTQTVIAVVLVIKIIRKRV